MNIYLSKNNERLGPFPIEKIGEMVRKGEFLMSDLAWREGMAAWQPIHTLPDVVESVLPPIPVGQLETTARTLPPPLPEKTTQNNDLNPTVKSDAKTSLHTTSFRPNNEETEKRILPVFLLSFFLGFSGAHAFYAGRIAEGFIFVALLSCSLILPFFGDVGFGIGILCKTALGIFWLVAIFRTALGLYKDGRGNKITKWT